MPNDKCRKLKFIPDEQFKKLIDLGASPVRPDSEIDRDCRAVEYEDKEEKYPAVEFIAKDGGFVEIKAIPPRLMQIEGPGGRIIGRAELTI